MFTEILAFVPLLIGTVITPVLGTPTSNGPVAFIEERHSTSISSTEFKISVSLDLVFEATKVGVVGKFKNVVDGHEKVLLIQGQGPTELGVAPSISIFTSSLIGVHEPDNTNGLPTVKPVG